MCPPGKTINLMTGDCNPCQPDQKFDEDFDNYFKSVCKFCPLGTVGGQGNECIPCPANYIYEQGKCTKCPADKVCPIGTKYMFSKQDLLQFHEIK